MIGDTIAMTLVSPDRAQGEVVFRDINPDSVPQGGYYLTRHELRGKSFRQLVARFPGGWLGALALSSHPAGHEIPVYTLTSGPDEPVSILEEIDAGVWLGFVVNGHMVGRYKADV